MKVKTSITLEKDLLEAIDKLVGQKMNRSEFIEAAIKSYIVRLARNQQNAKDLAIINESADGLNEEALDVLDYQIAL